MRGRSWSALARISTLSLLLAWFVWAPGALEAQEAEATPLALSAEAQQLGLLTLPDDLVIVHYTRGSLDRAARLQSRLRDLGRRIARWSKEAEPIEILVVSPEHWRLVAPDQPYGFPLRLDRETSLAPAWGTEDTVALWKGLSAQGVSASANFQVRGSAKEIASLALADLLLELEICRGFMSARQLAGGEDRLWLNDLFAHTLCTAHDEMRSYQDPVGLAKLLKALAEAEGARQVPPLEAYGPDLELADWLAYQAYFARGGQLIFLETGKASVRRLLRLQRRKGAPLVFDDLLPAYPNLGTHWR